jgi:TonB family protein
MQPSLIEHGTLAPPDRGKARALALSLGLHAAAFFALMEAPPLSLPALPPPSPTEYQQGFAGKEDKIVWYKFHELPNIAPRRSPKASQPLRAAVKAKQSIASSPKNAPARSQVVWTPAPAINDLPPLDLPNLLAVRLPPRQFTTPPDLVRADAPKIGLPDAPEALAGQLDVVTLPADRLPPRPFSAPRTPPKVPAAVGKIDAPDDVPVYQAQSTPAAKLPAVRLPSRPFVPPAPRPAPDAPPRKITGPTEAPALIANVPAAVTIPAGKLPARAFAPPPANRQVTRSAILPPDEPAPPPLIEANPGDLTIAIASLNPAAAPVKLPAASSPAQFSAGEKVRPNGADADGGDIAISAPDLYAHAGNETKPDLVALAYAAPTSKEALQGASRYGRPTPGDARAHPAATTPGVTSTRVTSTRVTSAPDPRFNGRDIYMIAIQMPNLTSYSGSWLMWYADRAAREGGLPPIAAPVPHRKVDPKYIAAEVDEHVEGRVQLYCVIGREGTVTSIQLLRGIDDRLDRSAEEALSKWEFYPATRNGQPVDVDVVVEIPFVLAPRAGLKR